MASIVGPSGAGKSTLLRTINRLVEPAAGEIFLDGTPTREMNPLELRRRVGMVFQLPALFGETVADVVLYGLRLVGRSAEVGTQVAGKLRRLGELLTSEGRSLSG